MFYVKAKDSEGNWVDVEVSAEVYAVYVDEQKRKERERNEKRRHGTDMTLQQVLETKQDDTSLDESLVTSEKLSKVLNVISGCTKTQRRRFWLHHIEGYSFVEIAQKEGCNETSVYRSVQGVEKKLKKFQ